MNGRDIAWTIGAAVVIAILVNVPPISRWIQSLSWIWIAGAAVVTVVLLVLVALLQKSANNRKAQSD